MKTISVVIASIALAVSLSTFLTNRLRDKRDLLLRVHERLITADQQRGRGLIYNKIAAGIAVEDLTADEYSAINSALVTLDAAAIYYRRHYIRRKDFLRLWALTIVRVVCAAEPFLDQRKRYLGTESLPDLRAFAADAKKYLARNRTPVKAIEPRPAGGPDPDL